MSDDDRQHWTDDPDRAQPMATVTGRVPKLPPVAQPDPPERTGLEQARELVSTVARRPDPHATIGGTRITVIVPDAKAAEIWHHRHGPDTPPRTTSALERELLAYVHRLLEQPVSPDLEALKSAIHQLRSDPT